MNYVIIFVISMAITDETKSTELLQSAKENYQTGKTNDCLQDLKNLIQIAKGPIRIEAFDLLAKICVEKEQIAKAITLYKNSLNHVPAEDWVTKANIYNKIGLLLQAERDLEGAIGYQQLCLEALEKSGNQSALAVTLRNLGRLYTLSGKHVEALKAHQKSLELKRILGDIKGVAILYETYAQDLEYNEKYPEAIHEYEKAMKIFNDLGMSKDADRIASFILRVKAEIEANQEFNENDMYLFMARNAF
jgi:tetratricopeptide (TPR) repeat protein